LANLLWAKDPSPEKNHYGLPLLAGEVDRKSAGGQWSDEQSKSKISARLLQNCGRRER